VILGLGPTRSAFDAEPGEMLAQPRERPLVQKSGEIIRTIGQKFPAPEADEEIELFPLAALGVGAAGGFRERRVGKPEEARIAAQAGEAFQQTLIGRAHEQDRKQCVLVRPRGIDLVDSAGRIALLGVQIGPQDRAVDAGHGLDCEHSLRRYVRPIGNRWLGNADFFRKRAYAASDTNGFIETRIPHESCFINN
jgi:hypothetical protein